MGTTSEEKPVLKKIGVSEERRRRLKVLASIHNLKRVDEALEMFGGPAIDAEYDRVTGGGSKPPRPPKAGAKS